MEYGESPEHYSAQVLIPGLDIDRFVSMCGLLYYTLCYKAAATFNSSRVAIAKMTIYVAEHIPSRSDAV